jgi:hypothetical protein
MIAAISIPNWLHNADWASIVGALGAAVAVIFAPISWRLARRESKEAARKEKVRQEDPIRRSGESKRSTGENGSDKPRDRDTP